MEQYTRVSREMQSCLRKKSLSMKIFCASYREEDKEKTAFRTKYRKDEDVKQL